MRTARAVLTSIFAALIATTGMPASAEPAPAAADLQPIALVRLTSGPGDKLLEELCRGMLQDSHRWVVVKTVAAAEYVGKLEIVRRGGNTELTLTVSKRDKLLVRARQLVGAGQSVIDGVQQLVAQATGALDGKPPQAQVAAPDPVSPRDPEPLRPSRRQVKRIDEEDAADGSDDDDRKHLDFLVGLEGSFGPMSLDSQSVANGSAQGFDLSHYGPAFTANLDGHVHGALALHAGAKFDWSAFELAWQASRWSGGAATLWGPRLSFYPLAALWPVRKLELGVDLGFGYSLLSSGGYDMTGTYFAIGLTGEYPITKALGIVAYYRLFTPFLKNFYYDYSRNLSAPVSGVTAYWNTFGIGLNWHPPIRW